MPCICACWIMATCIECVVAAASTDGCHVETTARRANKGFPDRVPAAAVHGMCAPSLQVGHEAGVCGPLAGILVVGEDDQEVGGALRLGGCRLAQRKQRQRQQGDPGDCRAARGRGEGHAGRRACAAQTKWAASRAVAGFLTGITGMTCWQLQPVAPVAAPPTCHWPRVDQRGRSHRRYADACIGDGDDQWLQMIKTHTSHATPVCMRCAPLCDA